LNVTASESGGSVIRFIDWSSDHRQIVPEHEKGDIAAGRGTMFFRILCTAVASLFAILAFCGFGPMPSLGARISFGLGFLLIAFLIWRSWRFIVGDFSPAIMDAVARRHVDADRRKTGG
jgi:hypothetical protein